jgi:hypothetical protein
VVEVAKAVSDVPCGGQIMITGDTMAHIHSMTDLTERVAHACSDWQVVTGGGGKSNAKSETAGMSILHLGSHLLSSLPETPPGTQSSRAPVLPAKPKRGGGAGDGRLNSIDASGGRQEAVRFADLVEDNLGDGTGGVEEEAPSVPRWEMLQGQPAKLCAARELLVVVPWPLRCRAM